MLRFSEFWRENSNKNRPKLSQSITPKETKKKIFENDIFNEVLFNFAVYKNLVKF